MILIHVDMDMFFAAVEIRDNPALAGKPLIIGALPGERGVVSTCSYEARRYGVHSAMSISEAYRLCPHGVFLRPGFDKYVAASRSIHRIWEEYTDQIEYISLDEGFLDVTGSLALFGGAEKIGREIQERIRTEVGLPCSVGIGYCMMAAKLASEEKKPGGFFQILTPEALRELIIDRSIRVIYGIGQQSESELNRLGIYTVRDLLAHQEAIIQALGPHGRQLVDLANGIDPRVVSVPAKAQSLGKEITFQRDVTDRTYLQDVLRLIARELSFQIRLDGAFCRTVTLKITFWDMKKVTRSRTTDPIQRAVDIYRIATELLEKIERHPIRLVGISLSGFTGAPLRQLSLFDDETESQKSDKLDGVTMRLQRRYGMDIVKSGSEMMAERRLHPDLAADPAPTPDDE